MGLQPHVAEPTGLPELLLARVSAGSSRETGKRKSGCPWVYGTSCKGTEVTSLQHTSSASCWQGQGTHPA